MIQKRHCVLLWYLFPNIKAKLKQQLSQQMKQKFPHSSQYINKFTFFLVVGVVDDVEVVGDLGDVGQFGGFVVVGLVT